MNDFRTFALSGFVAIAMSALLNFQHMLQTEEKNGEGNFPTSNKTQLLDIERKSSEKVAALVGEHKSADDYANRHETIERQERQSSKQDTQYSFGDYEFVEHMIPMRDGVRLKTYIAMPKNPKEPLPFLMVRTPYGAGNDLTVLFLAYQHFVTEGYIFVYQDIRGRYDSEGEFKLIRCPVDKSDATLVDEGTDANDTVKWLLENIGNNNGNVGVHGISYGGWTAMQTMIDPHPAIKAVSPQASPGDLFLGDDIGHNGAFRLAPSFGYAAMMEPGKRVKPYRFDQKDAFEFYLDLGPLSNANSKYLKGKSPSWNDFMAHPNYDQFWKKRNVNGYLDECKVPALHVAGWWDAEDLNGPLNIYDHLETDDSNNRNFLVVGPWGHGDWAHIEGDSQWEIDFGSNTCLYYKNKVEAPWFAYHLKGKGELKQPEALTFQTGSNQWESHDQWPPTNVTHRNLYFCESGKLSFEKPKSDSKTTFDDYVSDPAKPIPYTKRPIQGFWQGAQAYWKFEDQRFVHLRPDVLSWETEPLEDDLVVTGKIIAQLFAATTGSDADWVVKVIDVHPEKYRANPSRSGYQLMIADEVLRAKYRNSFETPEPVPPNEVVHYTIDLNSRNHCFRKGHRIMIQVQSTWFPLYDRNPQTFVDIPKALESDYRRATHKIFRSGESASHVVLPIVDAISNLNSNAQAQEASPKIEIKLSTDLFDAPVAIKVGGKPFNSERTIQYPSPALIDIDNDGELELVVGSLVGTLTVLENEALEGEPLWNSPELLKSAGKTIELPNW